MACQRVCAASRRACRPCCYGGMVAELVMSTSRRGLLIAAEGLDGSGTTAALGALGGWLERAGHRVRIVQWENSRLVVRASTSGTRRRVLTPRAAALLAAVDTARRVHAEIAPAMARGDIVLCDRYAWTGIARDAARGLDAAWLSALYRFCPRPDLVLLTRDGATAARARAFADRPMTVHAEAVAWAFDAYLERMVGAYDALAGGRTGPWAANVIVLDAQDTAGPRAVRDTVRGLLHDMLEPV